MQANAESGRTDKKQGFFHYLKNRGWGVQDFIIPLVLLPAGYYVYDIAYSLASETTVELSLTPLGIFLFFGYLLLATVVIVLIERRKTVR